MFGTMGMKRLRSSVKSDHKFMKVQKHLQHDPPPWGPTKEACERLSSLYSAETRLEELMTKTLTLGESSSPFVFTATGTSKSSKAIRSKEHRRRRRLEHFKGRRSTYSSLEKERRVDLRYSFEYLRLLVPETKILDKIPKIQILKKAALHCKHLQQTEQQLLKEKEKLKKQLEELEQLRLQCS
nr:myc protein-like isoform X1 [Cherax quadricarinatus]XP_053656374.1 myc protein-like isoform X1 [Cherax quadricarinatus]XP_053656375.1 myc protein-like isoform X1 [Cherax quadricarinatus]XP_053656376.1 myc protein-like isoform X1 [Cherax quadricarinatus]XP_053656377.1 myc protein-like isoform X1 [Cherax quadricarinatus]XP_053656378.1 myc protein-like isoform X1 [Cherax quadricarinatus]XP_053656379.1 myc protein-like isoform X1 [Cherax quadricarinatus]XP_053656380.1 myc protein-like isoform